MAFTKLDQADLDSPCREFSNGGLSIAVAFLVCWQINFLLTRIGRLIQLYRFCLTQFEFVLIGHSSQNLFIW